MSTRWKSQLFITYPKEVVGIKLKILNPEEQFLFDDGLKTVWKGYILLCIDIAAVEHSFHYSNLITHANSFYMNFQKQVSIVHKTTIEVLKYR